jgi:arabinose-5-phosphate isomerase
MDSPSPFDQYAAAVRAAGQAAGPALEPAAAQVRRCRGLVACAGAGKSGIVARKLASSLATLGRRALWLDPGAAAHGEAALLGANDLLVLVSRSGESDEVVALALGAPCPVLALCDRPLSRLGRAAALVLPCGGASDPEGLPPSTSWLAMAAVAEALVAAVGAAGEAVHPAGALGRAREIPVARVMHPPPGVDPEQPVSEVLGVLTRHALGAVLLEQDGLLLGIITDGDLRRAVEREGAGALDLPAQAIATRAPVSVREAASLGEALRLMEDRPSQIAVLPVLDEQDRVVGLVRLHDLVRAGLG